VRTASPANVVMDTLLEKPDLQDARIIACLQREYGLPVEQVAFLPVGADMNTAVYRALHRMVPLLCEVETGRLNKICDLLTYPRPGHHADYRTLTTGTGQLWRPGGLCVDPIRSSSQRV
jgi:spectinomycin phosphotransferase